MTSTLQLVGFPTNTPSMPCASQQNLLHSKQKSLLSQLLAETGVPALPCGIASSEGTEGLEESDEGDYSSEEESDEEMQEASEAGQDGSQPISIPVSGCFLKQQREALKRFVYLHQIEEMRRHCQAYFERQERLAQLQGLEQAPQRTHPRAQPAAAQQQLQHAQAVQQHQQHQQHHHHAHQPGF